MPENDVDLLAIDRGMVTAPAGCGKTQLIANALARHSDSKPILVLTHTNAGVVALRGRLDRLGISSKVYRLATIDGWAMRLISTFPVRSAHNANLLKLDDPETDYPNIRVAAARLLRAEHINDILAASYARLFVDEYQDCSVRQHAIIAQAALTLPTCVLGDRLQAIFGFGRDELADWDQGVCAYFPLAGELETPWRWIKANSEPLKRWLLEVVRANLMRAVPVDLRTAPACVRWVALDGTEDHKRRLLAARTRPPSDDGRVLVICSSPRDVQQQIASQTPGAVTVEAVDLKDLLSFAKKFNLSAPDALKQLADFAQSVMRNVGATDLQSRVRALMCGTARNPPTNVEKAAVAFAQAPSHRAAADVLVEIGRQGGVTAHRPAVLRACLNALEICFCTDGLSFYDAAILVREQNRLVGRPLPKLAVGSTLLLKGLEAETAVITHGDSLKARDLYVAMTRGSKSLIVCSSSVVLNPAPQSAG